MDDLMVADVVAWRDWLDANEDASDGVWLHLAKKGTRSPTSLTYAEALDEALCSGWIDGQKKGHDAATFLQRFTPRRARWRMVDGIAPTREQRRPPSLRISLRPWKNGPRQVSGSRR